MQGDLIKSEGGCGGTPCIDDYDCGDGGPDSCVCDTNGECLWIPQVQGDMIKAEGGCGGLPCIDDYDCGEGGPDDCYCEDDACVSTYIPPANSKDETFFVVQKQ